MSKTSWMRAGAIGMGVATTLTFSLTSWAAEPLPTAESSFSEGSRAAAVKLDGLVTVSESDVPGGFAPIEGAAGHWTGVSVLDTELIGGDAMPGGFSPGTPVPTEATGLLKDLDPLLDSVNEAICPGDLGGVILCAGVLESANRGFSVDTDLAGSVASVVVGASSGDDLYLAAVDVLPSRAHSLCMVGSAASMVDITTVLGDLSTADVTSLLGDEATCPAP